jgi:hypothetical protein
VLIANRLSVAIRDKYPVTDWHVLVVPKRHTSDYFDLGTVESRACHRLITEARSLICKADHSVAGFNVGINSGVGHRSDCDALPHSSHSTADWRSPQSAGRSASSDSSEGGLYIGSE